MPGLSESTRTAKQGPPGTTHPGRSFVLITAVWDPDWPQGFFPTEHGRHMQLLNQDLLQPR